MKNLWNRVTHLFAHNFVWLGLCSLVWLILRSGTKPSRLQYPCQRAAVGASSLFLGSFALPAVAHGLRGLGLPLPRIHLSKRVTSLSGALVILAILSVAGWSALHRAATPQVTAAAAPATAGVLPAWTSTDSSPSNIFVIDSFPNPDTFGTYHQGVDSLFSLMAANGLFFYKSAQSLPWCDTNGTIGKNDVVLLKVNAEWDQRGQTNGDVIKGVIARILAHPDTFTGEVELVENGQWRQSWTYAQNNAENTAQTMQSIVDTFAARGFHVGAYDWTAIGYGSHNRWVSEYDQGDTISGYVKEDSSGMTYAKFTTRYGTRVSVRKGVWNDSTYEPERLKFLNMPVLKSHSYMGVSASVKHYIGFLDYTIIGPNTMHQRAMAEGLLGVNFGKARFPNLNIIDATWVMGELSNGPNAPYNLATRQNILVASLDPIAADYYAGKHVIRPISWWSGHPWLHDYGRMDPDNLNTENPGSGRYSVDSTPCSGMPYNAFHQMLVSNRDKMLAYGKQVTMDTLQMSVHVFSFRQPTGVTELTPFQPALVAVAEPDPSRGPVTIRYQLDSPQTVSVRILDAAGRLVRRLSEAPETPGSHRLTWDRNDGAGRRVAAGTYLVSLETPNRRATAKVVLTTNW